MITHQKDVITCTFQIMPVFPLHKHTMTHSRSHTHTHTHTHTHARTHARTHAYTHTINQSKDDDVVLTTFQLRDIGGVIRRPFLLLQRLNGLRERGEILPLFIKVKFAHIPIQQIAGRSPAPDWRKHGIGQETAKCWE